MCVLSLVGCDTGFGNLTAKALDKSGYIVHACCLTQEGRDSLSKAASSRMRTHLLDVTKDEDLERLVHTLRESSVTLWALINNAGEFFTCVLIVLVSTPITLRGRISQMLYWQAIFE